MRSFRPRKKTGTTQQLYLNFEDPPQAAHKKGDSPREPLGTNTCVLVREMEGLAREGGLRRRVLLARTRGEGKELLRQLALRGFSWVGFDVTTVRLLAVRLASARLGPEGISVLDVFEEQARIEQAIDDVLLSPSRDVEQSRFQAFVNKVGFRDAVRRSIVALRMGGIRAKALGKAVSRSSEKQILITSVLARFETLLREARLADLACVLELALEALGEDTWRPPENERYYLVPGLPDRGLEGRFLRQLQHRGAGLLRTDPVEGLRVPRGILWDVAPPAATGSYLHAVERPGERPGGGIEVFAAASVYDELRGVLRRVLDRGARWDEVEIITSDAATYGSALHALAVPLGIPVTFSVGLPVERTRPGRVVSTYFRWIRSGFQESDLRALVESKDIEPPAPYNWIAGPRLARTLRRLRIGWGRARYMDAIERGLSGLDDLAQGRFEDEQGFLGRKKRQEEDLRALEALLRPVLAATPPTEDDRAGPRTSVPPGTLPPGDGEGSPALVSPAQAATGVKSLLARMAAGTPSDETAQSRLMRLLDRIEATLHRKTDSASALAIVQGFLRIRIPTPRAEGMAPWTSAPGHLHLTDLEHGGATGRRLTFITGLDAGRFPGTALEDPLLLDRERLRLRQGVLPLARDRSAEARFLFAALFARIRGDVTLSYLRWDPSQARAMNPAPEMLQAYRLREGDRTLTFEDLERHLGEAESRLPRSDVRGELDADDVWLRTLVTDDGRLRNGLAAAGRAFPGLGQGLAAAAALRGSGASVHTGILGTASPFPSYQDLSERVFSASGLGDLGACPRRFFLRYILRAYPPDDARFDPHRWLEPLERGKLLHTVYQKVLQLGKEKGLEPADNAFMELALSLVNDEGARTLIHTPSPSSAVYEWEMDALRNDVRSFVEMVRSDPPQWEALELSFGMDSDTAVVAGNKRILVRGAIDRIDRREDRLRVIDYKTGWSGGHSKRKGAYNGGRRFQHWLYTTVASGILGRPAERMEYHFPTRRGENRVKSYPAQELADGGALVATMLEGIAEGWFPATDNAKQDCRFCDYKEACNVREVPWRGASSVYATWTKRNLDDLKQLKVLRRTRRWED